MAESYDKYSVIVIHGPPYNGRPDWFKRLLLSETHSLVCPDDIFEKHPSFGLRDVALTVVQKLKKGRKVIIDSDNCTASARLSYITLIRKKLPHFPISIVEMLPKYGCIQLFWAREHDLARKAAQHRQNIVHERLRDDRIQKWFASEDDVSVTYRKGIVEAPKEGEGAKIHKLKLRLTCDSVYKFEVPGLLIQWDVLQALCTDGKLAVGAITKVLKLWSSVCPCGRIIVICDGSSLKPGVKIYSQALEDIVCTMKQLTESFTDVPVYVLAVHNPGLSGGFTVPPRPGLIAYLQRRHCLDLHFKHTVYLYESQQHMKMAERAGVPHLKGSRVLEHPSLVTSRHAATLPSIPEMLKTIEVKQSTDDEHSGAIVPLFDLIGDFRDGYLRHPLAFGRTEYLFAKDASSIERYQSLYASKASKVCESGSKIAEDMENQSDINLPVTSQLNTSGNISRTTSESRDLPKWMLLRNESNSTLNSSQQMSRSDSTSSTDVKIKQTVYVMTEKELTEVAMDILKQAGRKDLVEQFQSRQRQLNESKKDSYSTPQNNRPKNQRNTRKKTKQCNIERSKQSHSDSAHLKCHRTEVDGKKSDESDSGMSLSDSDSWHSENESAHSHHVAMETDRHVDRLCDQDKTSEEYKLCGETSNQIPQNLENKQYCVEDVVNEALDDFLDTARVDKRKPRLKSEPATSSPRKVQRRMAIKLDSPQKSVKEASFSHSQFHNQTYCSELTGSQKKISQNLLGNIDSTAPKTLQNEKVLSKKMRNNSSHEEHKRKTPDLTILDELFG